MAAEPMEALAAIEQLSVQLVMDAARRHTDRQVQVPADSSAYRHVRHMLRSLEEVSGTPLRWNGRLVVDGTSGGGSVSLDGTLALPQHILDTIDRAYAGDVADLDAAQVAGAIMTVGHEGGHLAGVPAEPTAESIKAWFDPATKAFDEGLADHSGLTYYADIAIDTGLLSRVPGLLAEKPGVGYPAAWAATGTLVTHLHEVSRGKHEAHQIFRRLHRSPRTDRWTTAADIHLEAFPDPEAPAARDELRHDVGETVRTAFAEVAGADRNGDNRSTDDVAARMLTGQRLVRTACHAVTAKTLAEVLPGLMRGMPQSLTKLAVQAMEWGSHAQATAAHRTRRHTGTERA